MPETSTAGMCLDCLDFVMQFAIACLTCFMLGALCLATSRLLAVGSWHLLFAVPTGEHPTMGCNHTPYDFEAPGHAALQGRRYSWLKRSRAPGLRKQWVVAQVR